jgi:hypothetical protein
MPAELQIIRASEFVALDPDRHMDFEASKNELQKLAHACRKRGLNRALLDLRGLPVLPKPHFNTEEVAALVGAFRSAGFTRRQRLAVLYEHDRYGIIRNFTFFSRLRGLQVQSFLDYEKAMNWLSGEQESSPESQKGTEVPIVKGEVKKRPPRSATRRSRTNTPRTSRTKIKGLGASRLSSN